MKWKSSFIQFLIKRFIETKFATVTNYDLFTKQTKIDFYTESFQKFHNVKRKLL